MVGIAERRRHPRSRHNAALPSSASSSNESSSRESLHPHANRRGAVRRTGLPGRELRERFAATNERKLDVRYDFRWSGRRISRAGCCQITSPLWRQRRFASNRHTSHSTQQKVRHLSPFPPNVLNTTSLMRDENKYSINMTNGEISTELRSPHFIIYICSLVQDIIYLAEVSIAVTKDREFFNFKHISFLINKYNSIQ